MPGWTRRFSCAWAATARPIAPGPAESVLCREISADCLIDDWGVTWRRAPGSLYFEMTEAPLRHAKIDDLERYPWPNLVSPDRFRGLAERAKAIQEAGYATVLLERNHPVRAGRHAPRARRPADGHGRPTKSSSPRCWSRSRAWLLPAAAELLRHVGPFVDVFVTGDDLGMTDGPMMSPQTYRRLIKPHQAELLAAIHKNTSGKVFFHSCGNIYRLLGDLVEVGVDLLNPVQVSAGEMGDTARLKREFGDRLSFCGGIDTQRVMPRGTPADVRQEVRRRIGDLAPGGGYVAAAVHCLQPDVPPANIVAMCEEVTIAGRYPLHV